MAAYDLEEQEQLEEIKAWWKTYGNMITWALLVISLSAAAWQGWNWYQREQAAKASVVFSVVQRASAEGDLQRVKTAAGELLEKYSSSSYAPMAALLAGKSAFDAGDLKTAKIQLSWAVDHASDELKDVARLRLAAVLLDEKAFDEALKVLEAPAVGGFEALYADLRGDVLLAHGKRSEAKTAYQLALQKKSANATELKPEMRNSGFSEVLQQKIDALGDA